MNINILLFLLFIFASAFFILFLPQSPIHQNKDSQIYREFEKWKEQFSVTFEANQQNFRLQIFRENFNKIQLHNSLPSRTYNLGINQFMHLTEKQFHGLLLDKPDLQTSNKIHEITNKSFINLGNLTDVDWQNLGKVSEVKNQGNCDAGYAFTTTSLIETSFMMQNQNILLSQQQIVDCSSSIYFNQGCAGGTRIGALNYALDKGLSSQSQYPYLGVKDKCKAQTGKYKVDFSVLESNGCQQIKTNLYMSPISLAANAKNWQLYNNGIFNNCPTQSQVNHQIFLVGVTLQYWRLKNSWGTRWGQNGYIRVKLGNTCGICQKPGYGFAL